MPSSYFKGRLVNHILSDRIERLKEWRKRNEISPSRSHRSVLFLFMK
jgi:hypothetical protein